ncbi:hypothetical protein JR316_0004666 [Psilocybe cubensis]|uniref:Uncharacterized protein n=2 Tax=Psilocybe cubensis TaxID=181762 RepID=A0ACB8H3Z8_PSICU|nr:hypothetical protein JR316_0004666 [Psilocybe cubensis]KAH9482566.1 hypothetical protein JR316_0004666 [Psilocybe cubensis]
MSYSTRNSFYLRISKNIVLPIYVYLDERHVNWMSDTVLQHVLSDLRPHILPKLRTEADGLKSGSSIHTNATVDTHRGDSYQFCYFIRKTEPHSVVIKTRNFRTAPRRTPSTISSNVAPSSSKRQAKRRDISTSNQAKNKRRRTESNIQEESDIAMIGEDDINADEASINADAEIPPIELEIEEEEAKPKPVLGLTYQGFSIYGQCLCVVVEPWPVVRSSTVAPVFAKATQSSQPIVRAQTPLFLPEEQEDTENHQQPWRSNINQAYLHQVLKEVDPSDNEDDMGGMLEYSQVLKNISGDRAGAVNDDEDIDGSILFGDADEFKEL